MSIACPKCRGGTAVIDSRGGPVDAEGVIRRRRKCRECAFRFTTLELSNAIISRLLSSEQELQLAKAFFGGSDAAVAKKESIYQAVQRLKVR